MLALILLIAAGGVLITGAAFAMVNDLSPAELARAVARFFRHFQVAGKVTQRESGYGHR